MTDHLEPLISHDDVGEPDGHDLSPQLTARTVPPLLPGAIWKPTDGKTGQVYATFANPKVTLHTTETRGLPGYPNPPHLTLDVAGTTPEGFGTLWQHLPLDVGAYALRSPGHPTSPNSDAGWNLQIEMIGYAKDTPNWSTEQIDLVASVIAAAIEHFDVGATLVPFDFVGSEGYGTDSPWRYQSFAEFAAFSGICAHQHVWYNSHWDAGAVDTDALAAAVLAILEPAPTPEEVPGMLPILDSYCGGPRADDVKYVQKSVRFFDKTVDVNGTDWEPLRLYLARRFPNGKSDQVGGAAMSDLRTDIARYVANGTLPPGLPPEVNEAWIGDEPELAVPWPAGDAEAPD